MAQVNARENREYLNRNRFSGSDGPFRLSDEEMAFERYEYAPGA